MIREAHVWRRKMTSGALASGGRIVVANTFTRLLEMAPYHEKTDNILILEADGKWQNTHGISPEALEKMALRWEKLPS